MMTEIQKISLFENNNDIYIKRDDLLAFSMGGNKVRISEAFFKDMVSKGCDAMIIYGSVHSNLCRVLSNMCCSRNIECIMICSHDGHESSSITNNTHLINWAGAEIVNCDKNDIASTVDSVMNRLNAEGKKPYYIYGDKYGRGNEGTAAIAYAEAYKEITDFEKEQGWEFDYIFCPSGTGATQSGLICGHLMAKDAKKIMGIVISSRETERAYQIIAGGVKDYFIKHNKEVPSNYLEEILLLDQYKQEGYGLYDERITSLIEQQYRLNGIPLDPIYTGKAFWGMSEYIKENNIKNKKILFLHTGGTPLFYDYLVQEGDKRKSC